MKFGRAIVVMRDDGDCIAIRDAFTKAQTTAACKHTRNNILLPQVKVRNQNLHDGDMLLFEVPQTVGFGQVFYVRMLACNWVCECERTGTSFSVILRAWVWRDNVSRKLCWSVVLRPCT